MNPTSQPHVSIVTPVYNNAADLGTCLESILAQTYENWDCTVVNNCSSDASAEIAYRYAQKDRRIRVHENSQLLAAIANHNASLRLISPACKYCKVVFGDDWIFPECLERMVALAEEHPAVGIVGAYVLEGVAVTCTGLPYPSTVLSGRVVCRRLLLDRVFVFGSANSLLYRADLVRSREPFYNESNIHADNEVCFALLKECDFGFVHQVLTFTRVREGSLNAKSREMQTGWADWLLILLSYGRDYLDDTELKAILEAHLAAYYRFLGKSVLQGRRKEFWDYHKGKIAQAGGEFSRFRVSRGMLETLWDLGLNPKRTVEKLLARASPMERVRCQTTGTPTISKGRESTRL